MKTKKLVKKITALAGSAVMLASTVAGAMAALPDLPSPFVTNGAFDAYVGVGATANVADVISAVELGAAFAQRATTSAGEGAIIEKDVTPGFLESVADGEQLYFRGKPVNEVWSAGDEGFSWLMNETIEYNDTLYTMESYVKVDNLMASLNEYATYAWKHDEGVRYNITANDTLPTGFDEFDFLGDRYQIVSLDTGAMDLGQIEEVTMTLNEETDVGGIATITAVDLDQIHGKVKIAVEDNAGNEISSVWYSESDVYNNDTLGLKFTVDSFYKSTETGIAEVTLNWETSSLSFENNGGYDPTTGKTYSSVGSGTRNWTVKLDASASGFVSMELRSWGEYASEDNFPKESFKPGETVSLLDGFFDVEYHGIYTADASDDEPGELTTISIAESVDTGDPDGSNPEFIFTGSNEESVQVDISPLSLEPDENYRSDVVYTFDENLVYYQLMNDTADNSVNLTVYNYEDDSVLADCGVTSTTCNFNLTNSDIGEIYYTVAWDNDTAMNVPINMTVLNFTANGEFFGDNMTFVVSGDVGTLTFTEPTGKNTIAKYDYNMTEGSFNTDPTYDGDDMTEGSAAIYSSWGSLIGYAENNLNIEYPETRRYAKITVGRSTTQEQTIAVGDSIPDSDWTLKVGGGDAINNIDPSFAFMDSELTTVDKPVILVGGPAVNTLVNGLGNETITVEEWQSMVNGSYVMESRAIIDMVANAFNTNTALVVAGFDADDTRIACRILARELLFGDTTLGENWTGLNRITLDTTGVEIGQYTTATVVE